MAIFRLSPSGLAHFWGCTALKIAHGTRTMSQFSPCSAPKLGQTQPRMKRQQTLVISKEAERATFRFFFCPNPKISKNSL
jgi:hypothetical protein